MPHPARSSRRGSYDDALGRKRLSLATRSDLSIEAQVTAQGATWIDRRLLAQRVGRSAAADSGSQARDAMERRVDHLVGEGLARRQGQRVIFARDLLNTLRRRDAGRSCRQARHPKPALLHRPSSDGEHVVGTYRQRVTLASGRFAMIDDGTRLSIRAVATGTGASSWSRSVRCRNRRGTSDLEHGAKKWSGHLRRCFDRFLHADLSEHTTRLVERLPIRRG